MSRLRSIAVRLGRLFGAARREREWKAEFESHLEMHVADKMRAGISAEEARRQALAEFGGLESTKDSMRDRAGFVWLESALRDIGYAWRGLRRSPAFAAGAILSLAASVLPSHRFPLRPAPRGVRRKTALTSAICFSLRRRGRPDRSPSSSPANPISSKACTQYSTVRGASPNTLATSGQVMPCATSNTPCSR